MCFWLWSFTDWQTLLSVGYSSSKTINSLCLPFSLNPSVCDSSLMFLLKPKGEFWFCGPKNSSQFTLLWSYSLSKTSLQPIQDLSPSLIMFSFLFGLLSFSTKFEVRWSRSVVSDSLQPHGLWPTRLLPPWDSPGKSTGVGCHFLLQGIFPTREAIFKKSCVL